MTSYYGTPVISPQSPHYVPGVGYDVSSNGVPSPPRWDYLGPPGQYAYREQMPWYKRMYGDMPSGGSSDEVRVPSNYLRYTGPPGQYAYRQQMPWYKRMYGDMPDGLAPYDRGITTAQQYRQSVQGDQQGGQQGPDVENNRPPRGGENIDFIGNRPIPKILPDPTEHITGFPLATSPLRAIDGTPVIGGVAQRVANNRPPASRGFVGPGVIGAVAQRVANNRPPRGGWGISSPQVVGGYIPRPAGGSSGGIFNMPGVVAGGYTPRPAGGYAPSTDPAVDGYGTLKPSPGNGLQTYGPFNQLTPNAGYNPKPSGVGFAPMTPYYR